MRFPLLLVKLSFLTLLPIVSVFAKDPDMVRHFDYDKNVKLKPLPSKVIDSVPDLYQPPRATN